MENETFNQADIAEGKRAETENKRKRNLKILFLLSPLIFCVLLCVPWIMNSYSFGDGYWKAVLEEGLSFALLYWLPLLISLFIKNSRRNVK